MATNWYEALEELYQAAKNWKLWAMHSQAEIAARNRVVEASKQVLKFLDNNELTKSKEP